MSSLTFANITRAAIAQDWSVERTAKQHRRLIPPDKSKPIVIGAGTTGDPKAIRHFLSQMRQSGFVWPWPPQPHEDASDPPGFQMRVSQSDELDEHDEVSDEMSGDDGIRDQWIPVVADRPIAPGYSMNIDGAVKSPNGRVLTPELKGRQLWIQFKLPGESGYVTKRSRLDKVVLLTWVGEPVEDVSPVHINGDLLDCRPDNLRWPCETKPWREPENTPPKRDMVGQAASNGVVHFDEDVADLRRSTEETVARERDVSDDVSVKFVLSNHGIDLVGAFTATGAFGDYSIITSSGRVDGLSGDDLKAFARWQKVADKLWAGGVGSELDTVAEAICEADPDMQGARWPGKTEVGKEKYRRMARAANAEISNLKALDAIIARWQKVADEL